MSNHKPSSAKFQEVVLHFVFTPKYRRAMFTGEVAQRLQALIVEACQVLDVEIMALGIQPDHVHLLVVQSRSVTTADLVQRVKGRTSYYLRQEFPQLTEISPKALWGRDFFIRSVGGGRAAVRSYIKAQGLD